MRRLHFLFLLGLLAAASAYSVNLSLEELLRSDTLLPGEPPSRPRAAAEGAPPLDRERLARLMGVPLRRPSTEPAGAEPTINPDWSLLGTLRATDPRWSLATVEPTTGERHPRTVRVGDALGPFAVAEIGHAFLTLEREGRRERVPAHRGGAAARPPPRLAERPHAVAGAGSGVLRLSDREFEVPRSAIDPTGPRAQEIFRQAQFGALFRDGKLQGFSLRSFVPGSIYEQLGAQRGDLIQRINGLRLDDPATLTELFAKLQTATRFEVELERNGARQVLSYRLRND